MGKVVKSIVELLDTLDATAERRSRDIMKMESDAQQQEEIYNLALEALVRRNLMMVLETVASAPDRKEERKHLPELVLECRKVMEFVGEVINEQTGK